MAIRTDDWPRSATGMGPVAVLGGSGRSVNPEPPGECRSVLLVMKRPPVLAAFVAVELLTGACQLSNAPAYSRHEDAPPTSDDGAGGGDDSTADGRGSDSIAGTGGSDSIAGGAGSDSTAGTGSNGSAGSPASQGAMLSQAGNPIRSELADYLGWLASSGDEATRLAQDEIRADNIITWQLPHGGFYKNDVSVYDAAWNGSDARSGWTGASGVELGTIDNNATASELMFLADVYARSGDTKYRESARATLEFLLGMQYPSGGFPQVYPARVGTTYSNLVTFNDDAMVRALLVLQQAAQLTPPLDGDLFTSDQRDRAQTAVASGVEFILHAQLEHDGVMTVWCAQHDPVTYEPKGARSYELPSKSGSESVGIVAFLMTQPQTDEIHDAVHMALAWFESDAVRVADTAYVSRPSGSTDDTYNPIQPSPGSTMWYRFYDLDQDVGFFSGRLPTDDPPGVGKKYEIMEIEPERRYGYQWGGSWATPLIGYARSVGY